MKVEKRTIFAENSLSKESMMHHNITTPKQALNPAYRKQNPERKEIDCFKKEFSNMLDRINLKESEEYHKGLIKDFLNAVYYKDQHFINIKENADLVIHNEKHPSSSVGVLFEIKSPTNKTEMVSRENLNVKSLQQLVFYYLKERKKEKNTELRYLIITNIYEWFVFDARNFENTFGSDTQLEKKFFEFENKASSITKVPKFYQDIVSPVIDKYFGKIEFTYFDIRDYETNIRNANKEDDRKLIALYKLLSPVHLLKLPFAKDTNELNKNFYAELLHIIGLEEVVQDGKKLIVRKKEGTRESGSIIENAMEKIVDKNKMENVNPESFGKTKEEQLFGVSLDLAITWINRILFLKLLESQILKYHNGNKDYAFLSTQKLSHYNDLDNLFFKVLALKEEERDTTNKAKFAHVPYLNSSLFEITDTEEKTICIDSLPDNIQMALYPKSVLYERGGSTGDPCGRPTMRPLEYLLKFLDAYDFSSEGSEDIQEENKPLISASVLGLIFEKINGYKDGSFFTPSFITMYMCRETISRAVIQKFNETKQWNCETIDQLYNKIESLEEANTIFNSIRICDPAVGSGHFLVSALNEMIYLKSELGILLYKNSERKLKDYRVTVENDELIITDNEGNYFHYNPKDTESQKVQETFFHEKQILIENCLFGVDINPNSVKICQLRLWIELLKHTYYIMENGELRMENEGKVSPAGGGLRRWKQMENRRLQTLPNIDINIKCGNSLVSRYDLHDKYLDVAGMAKKIKEGTEKYRKWVFLYKTCDNKKEKVKIVKNIETEKKFLYSIPNAKDNDYQNLQKAKNALALHITGYDFFATEVNEFRDKTTELTEKANHLQTIYNNKIQSCFEWRFEFPEVLDDDGNFVGFDVVIGNPPYVAVNQNKIYSGYQTFKCFELYAYFFERSLGLLKENALLAFITASLYLKGVKFQSLRDFLIKNFDLVNLINEGDNVFPDVKMPTSVFLGKKGLVNSWNFENMNDENSLLKKMRKNTVPIIQISKIMRGLEFGRDKIQNSGDIPFITGSNVCKYGVTRLSFIDENTLKDFSKERYFFEGGRLLIRETGSEITALYLDNLLYSNRSLYSIKIIDKSFNPKFVLGCLNSKLLQFYYQAKFKAETELFPKIRIIQAKELPIPDISLSEQQPIITLVNQILSAKKENPAADTAELERAIDLLVYSLYNLTEEEIKIIEK